MKIVVTSDLHFGDPHCVMVEKIAQAWKLRRGVDIMLEALNNLDLLILLGDVFDFSIEAYEEAFAASLPFFDLLKKIGVKQILCVPGNHDAMLWHALEYNTRITRSLADPAERVAKPLRKTMPAIVRTEARTVELLGIKKPGTIFLTDFTGIPFFVAHPNIYLVTDQCTVLLTHGQYLESFWAVGGELTQRIAFDDLNLGASLSLRQVVDFNHPLTQLACTGIGQAGELTAIARLVQHEVKNHTVDEGSKTDKYLGRLATTLDEMLTFKGLPGFFKEVASDIALCFAHRWIKEQLRKYDDSRGNTSWLKDPEVAKRFASYYQACLDEIQSINITSHDSIKVSHPLYVVLGHSHVPEAWATPYDNLIINQKMLVCNTGGWLSKDTARWLVYDRKEFNLLRVW